jgi:hypothetical protein
MSGPLSDKGHKADGVDANAASLYKIYHVYFSVKPIDLSRDILASFYLGSLIGQGLLLIRPCGARVSAPHFSHATNKQLPHDVKGKRYLVDSPRPIQSAPVTYSILIPVQIKL